MNDTATGHSVRARAFARARSGTRVPLAAALALFILVCLFILGCLGFLAGVNSAEAAALAPPVPQRTIKADRILVFKGARKLELLHHGTVLKTYPIALGSRPIGPKHAAGDGKTPEGVYYIDARLPQSRYHLALHVSYPNAADKAQAAAYHRDPGGDIMIHGLPAWFRGSDPDRFYKDWTKGCVSVGNAAIEEIYAAVDIGTPIEIRP